MANSIKMAEWGKDHWTLLAYVETCAVDHDGYLDARRLRANGAVYPTRLSGFALDPTRIVEGHSDYDCLADLAAAGLVRPAEGTKAAGRVPFRELEARARRFQTASARNATLRWRMTEAGQAAAAALRVHKASGSGSSNFRYPLS